MLLPHVRQARHARYKIATPSTPPIDHRAGSQLSVTELLFSVVHMARPPKMMPQWMPLLFQNDCVALPKWFRRRLLPLNLRPWPWPAVQTGDRLSTGHLGPNGG